MDNVRLESDRPIGITIVGGVILFLGILRLCGGAAALVPGTLFICFAWDLFGGAIWGILIGALQLAYGSALLSGRPWAYPVITILVLLALVGEAISFLTTGRIGFFNLALNLFLLWYINTPDVKRFFRQA
jgi:hypothetical protein